MSQVVLLSRRSRRTIVMRIALISDLHANEIALSAVFRDIEREGADQIICLGDVATLGPHPRIVLDMVRQLKTPCIMGNHDAFLLDRDLIRTYTSAPVILDAVDWCRDELSKADLDFVRTFEPYRAVELDHGATALWFHGTPRSHTEDLLAVTPPDKVDEMLDNHRATVMAGGHTHLQMLRQHHGILIVNPGSVGCPFKDFVGGEAPKVMDHAEYAIVDSTRYGVSALLKRVNLDRQALRKAADATTNPMKTILQTQYS